MTMVERVAQVIEAAWVQAATAPGAAYDSEVLARAAIAAMREPGEKMIDALLVHGPTQRVIGWHREAIIRDWQAMIDAALKDKP